MNLVSDPRAQAVNHPAPAYVKPAAFKRPFASLTHEQQFRVLRKFADMDQGGIGTPMHYFHVRTPGGVQRFSTASNRLSDYIHNRYSDWQWHMAYCRRELMDSVLEQAYQVLQAARR